MINHSKNEPWGPPTLGSLVRWGGICYGNLGEMTTAIERILGECGVKEAKLRDYAKVS